MCIVTGVLAGLGALGVSGLAGSAVGGLSAAAATIGGIADVVLGGAMAGYQAFQSYEQQVAAAEYQEQVYENTLQAARNERDQQIAQERMRYGEQARELRTQSFAQQRQAIQERERIGAALSGLGQAGKSFTRAETVADINEAVQQGQIQQQQERVESQFALSTMQSQAQFQDVVQNTPRGVAPSPMSGLLGVASGFTRGAMSGLSVLGA
jgi:hypothetical protein